MVAATRLALLVAVCVATCPDNERMTPPPSYLIHYHQHKNAGLTVRWMLKRWNNTREMHGTRPQLVGVLDDANRKRGLVITFVREPVARSLSRFWYWRAKGSDSGKEAKARCATLAEYARTKMRANNQHEFMLGDGALGECDTRRRALKTFKRTSPRLANTKRRPAPVPLGTKKQRDASPKIGNTTRNGADVIEAKPENKSAAPSDVCAAGTAAYARRIDALLTQPQLFVGVVEVRRFVAPCLCYIP